MENATRVRATVASIGDVAGDLGARPAAAERKPDGIALRVAAVIDTRIVSGPGRQLAALAVALRAKGVELSVITFARGDGARPFPAYLADAGVPHIVIPERFPFDPALLQRLRRVLADLRPDVVQTHGYKPSTLLWVLRRWGARWPWVAFFHGATAENAKVRFYNWLETRVERTADEVVTMTTRQLGRGRNRHERTIYNAVLDLPPATDDAFVARVRDLALPKPRLLVLGRLSPEKGVDVMLEALALARRDGTRVGLLVVGDGPEHDRLVALADRLSLGDAVAFLPATSDVRTAYLASDAVVLPSRSEGLPNVMLEALAHDRPVLATDVGAVREVLGATRAGLVVPPESPEALAQALPRLLALGDDADARRDRQEVVRRFSVESRTAAHRRLYAEVLARRSPAPL